MLSRLNRFGTTLDGVSKNIYKQSLLLNNNSNRKCGNFIILNAEKSISMVGRSQEFGVIGNPKIVVQQKGKEIDYNDYVTTNKYGYMIVRESFDFGTESITGSIDGMNECGLTCDALYFPNKCKWPEKEKETTLTIRMRNVIDFILGNFANINLTGFLGAASSFSPIVLIIGGGLLTQLGKK